MFRNPEHAIKSAYWILNTRIESKNATLQVLEMLRLQFDPTFKEKSPTGFTIQDWHAQAVMVLNFCKRFYRDKPIAIAILRASYAIGKEFDEALMQLTKWLKPTAEIQEGVMIHEIVKRMFRNKPTLRELADRFQISRNSLNRKEQIWREKIFDLKETTLRRLDAPMREAGLVIADSNDLAA